VLVQVFDVETGFDDTLLNMNPDGWIPGVSNERNWIMLYGLDVCTQRQLIITGDSKGRVYFADARTRKEVAQCQLHKKGNKASWLPLAHPLPPGGGGEATLRSSLPTVVISVGVDQP
jgi:hypothetical protein